MSDYWIKVNESIDGPKSVKELKLLAKSGVLRATDFISNDRKTWIEAGKIKQLEFANEEREIAELETPSDDEYTLAPLSPRKPHSTLADSIKSSNLAGHDSKPAKFENRLDNGHNLAPDTLSQSDLQQTSRTPTASAGTRCPKCGVEHRLLREGKVLTGRKICPQCGITPGTCPRCNAKLMTDAAQQCLACGTSWHQTDSSSHRNRPLSLENLRSEVESIRKHGKPTQKCAFCTANPPNDAATTWTVELTRKGPVRAHRQEVTRLKIPIPACDECKNAKQLNRTITQVMGALSVISLFAGIGLGAYNRDPNIMYLVPFMLLGFGAFLVSQLDMFGAKGDTGVEHPDIESAKNRGFQAGIW